MTEPTSALASRRVRFHTKAFRHMVPFFIAGSAFVLYSRILDVYFNSDDFILLRTMAGHSVPKSIVDHLTSPWLSLHFFLMYRPVSSLAFYLLYAVFGQHPLGYHLLSISCHALNAILVVAIANSLTKHKDAHIGHAAGLLFAIHPLHPNAVVWLSAFPTILSALFVLVSLLCFLYFRDGGLPRYYLVSLVAFALGLGTYEPVIVYPALLIGCDWLRERGRVSLHRMKTLLLTYIPYVLLACVYLLVRRSFLGHFYFEAAFGHHSGLILDHMSFYHVVLAKLIYPLFSLDPVERAVRLGFFVCFAASVAISARSLLAEKEYVRIGFFVLLWTFLWTVVTEPVLSPSVGRYGYVASIGVCIGLSLLMISSIPFPAPVRKYLGATVLLLGVVFCYVRLLNQSLIAYEKAGKLTRTVQQQLVALDARSEGTHMYFMGNVPQFVVKDGYKFAQVLITGLADSVRPPFTSKEIPVYPFIDFSTLREVPAFASPRNIVLLSWNERLEQVQVASSPYPDQHGLAPLPNIEVLYPPDKERVKGFGHNLGFVFTEGSSEKFRFALVSAYMKPFLVDVSREEILQAYQAPAILGDRGVPEHLYDAGSGNDVLLVTLPRIGVDMFSNVQDLYGSETFWWVEGLDKEDNVVARSAMRSVRFER